MQKWMTTALAAAAVCFTAGLANAAGHSETVSIGFAAEPYPPFTSPNASGEWSGWEVDFMEAVCAEAKLKCEIKAVAWDGIIPALTSKKIDAIIGSMSITEERKKTIAFSDKYYKTPAAVVASKGSDIEPTPESLKGKILGVQTATTHQAYSAKYFEPVLAELKQYQTQDEANQDLAAGRIDATMADSLAMDTFVKSSAGACCEIVGNAKDDPAILGAGVGIGLRKEDTALLEKFNAAIKAIRANGTYDAFSKKYFDFDIYGG